MNFEAGIGLKPQLADDTAIQRVSAHLNVLFPITEGTAFAIAGIVPAIHASRGRDGILDKPGMTLAGEPSDLGTTEPCEGWQPAQFRCSLSVPPAKRLA